MKKYFKTVWLQTHDKDECVLSSSLPRGMSPVTPHPDVPDRFYWKWLNVDNCKSLRASLPIDGQETSSLSLILQASKEGDHELIQHLLQKEPASVQQVDVIGRTCLMYAVHFGHNKCLSNLLNSKIDINFQAHDGCTALHIAVHSGNYKGLEMLLKFGASADLQDSEGRAPLHWAAAISDIQCLQSLISPETSAMQDAEGKTAMHTASETGAIQACRVILDNGGDSCLNAVDFQSRTCVHLAALSAHGEVLHLLLEEGADVCRKDKWNATAWDYACNKNLHYCKLILQSFETQLKSRKRNSQEPKEENNNSAVLQARSVSPCPPTGPRSYLHNIPVSKRGTQSRGVLSVELQSPGIEGIGFGGEEAEVHEDSTGEREKTHSVEIYPEQQAHCNAITESRDCAIINKDMQPSDQLQKEDEESAFEEPNEGYLVTEVRLASVSSDMSEQSVNVGMNVSDCEEEEHDHIDTTATALQNVKIEEQLPVTMVSRHDKSNAHLICHAINEHPPRPVTPGLNPLRTASPKPAPQPQFTPAVKPQPMIPSSSTRLLPLAKIGKGSSKEMPKSRKKKKKDNGGDGQVRQLGPTKKTTRGFHPQSPAAPDEDKQVFRISRFNASQGSQIKSQGSAWEMSWEPRRPSTPTLPHSPRQLKQQVVGQEAQHPREFKRGHPPSTTNPNKRL
ncbi:ankycorbin-like isoform X2 [Asterias rubens]|uniref:ankycorbin-like isoform X2 n=1 Tax=Asterias rubens TaxID=7604 RepID=UPI001455680E|nr:ankycorbin-like isoform X2 [Asterias rubens]